MIYSKGFVLIAAEDTEENREEVRRYIKRHDLTMEQVRFSRNIKTGDLQLVVKTEVDLGTAS